MKSRIVLCTGIYPTYELIQKNAPYNYFTAEMRANRKVRIGLTY